MPAPPAPKQKSGHLWLKITLGILVLCLMVTVIAVAWPKQTIEERAVELFAGQISNTTSAKIFDVEVVNRVQDDDSTSYDIQVYFTVDRQEISGDPALSGTAHLGALMHISEIGLSLVDQIKMGSVPALGSRPPAMSVTVLSVPFEKMYQQTISALETERPENLLYDYTATRGMFGKDEDRLRGPMLKALLFLKVGDARQAAGHLSTTRRYIKPGSPDEAEYTRLREEITKILDPSNVYYPPTLEEYWKKHPYQEPD